MLYLKRIIGCLIGILCITTIWGQQDAQIASDELTFNFGTIAEANGLASHSFTVKNIGNAPLVITRITASCGCTQPEWSKEPIAPGKTGEIKVTFDPKGRPGPFYKTVSVFSNGKKGSYNLAIKGNVTPKPAQPAFTYPYSIGDLKLHTKTILYSSIRQDESLGDIISIKNESGAPMTIELGKVPHYLITQVNPATLQPDEVGQITILMDAKEVKHKGRVSAELPITVRGSVQKEVAGSIKIAANIIDNFNKFTTSEKAQAPIAQLSGTLLEFGQLSDKRSIVPLIGGKVSGTFEITNAGKSPLTIYSVTCDDERIDLSGGKKELKPGATATFKVTLRPKEIKTKLEALINVVCDDPNGPIRLIKVTAYK